MDATSCYSQTYLEARQKFLDAARRVDARVDSQLHPETGRDGEELALDAALDGPADAERLLIVSSACHGVEGFCGSGVQIALLADAAFRRAAQAQGVAVLHLHGLNPHGFSWWRRTTHENVDLNRNFHDFSKRLPANPAYDELADLLVPATWPPSDDVNRQIDRFVAERGMNALQAAVTGGQYSHPDGLFYGGRAPTWSHLAVREALRRHGGRASRIGWIDVHTGLGPAGVAELIHAGSGDAESVARSRRWWGEQVTSLSDGSSSSAPITGMMWQALPQECPQAVYTGMAFEVGTVPVMGIIEGLRADQWLQNHPEAAEPQRREIKQLIRNAFYVDTPEWKAQVLTQALTSAHQAVAGLASD